MSRKSQVGRRVASLKSQVSSLKRNKALPGNAIQTYSLLLIAYYLPIMRRNFA